MKTSTMYKNLLISFMTNDSYNAEIVKQISIPDYVVTSFENAIKTAFAGLDKATQDKINAVSCIYSTRAKIEK